MVVPSRRAILIAALCLLTGCDAFSSSHAVLLPSKKLTTRNQYRGMGHIAVRRVSPECVTDNLRVPDLDGLPISEIADQEFEQALSKVRILEIPVPNVISSSGSVEISFIHWPAEISAKNPSLPVLLIPGFDSSCLEFRRLGPKIAARGINVYAVDLLGWGFTGFEGVKFFSASSKVVALERFWKKVNGGVARSVVVLGASLGGAAAIEFASASESKYMSGTTAANERSNPVKGLILIDAQGFVDGVGPMAHLPIPLAKLGIQILKSKSLRSVASEASYYKPSLYATEDALRIGRLHTLRSGWEDGMLSFIKSGGFTPVEKVRFCDMKSLILWGRQDGILDGKQFANKFVEELPDAELTWIEECGHVPHLEQADKTANLIVSFVELRSAQNWKIQGIDLSALSNTRGSKLLVGAGALGMLGAVAAAAGGFAGS